MNVVNKSVEAGVHCERREMSFETPTDPGCTRRLGVKRERVLLLKTGMRGGDVNGSGGTTTNG